MRELRELKDNDPAMYNRVAGLLADAREAAKLLTVPVKLYLGNEFVGTAHVAFNAAKPPRVIEYRRYDDTRLYLKRDCVDLIYDDITDTSPTFSKVTWVEEPPKV